MERSRMMAIDEERGIAIVTDARIDNRGEIVGALGIAGDDLSDAALILRAYDRWGDACVERLIGDFVFVIDDRRRDRTLCARDHIGVRPFYYYLDERLFAAASEIKGLFALPEVPRRIDDVRIGDYMTGLTNDTAITFYQRIRRLPPSHTLTIARGGAELRRYASLDGEREIRLSSDAAYTSAFLERFVESVRCRIGDGRGVGAALSGGLDSSSVACVARDLLDVKGKGPLPTISVIFKEMKECDESRYIDAVTAAGGIDPHFIHGEKVSPLPDLDRLLHHLEEPFYAPNLFLHWAMYSQARELGIRIWLDGLDGDTTVSHGMAFLIELARSGQWLRLRREIAALSSQPSASSPLRLLRRTVINPLIMSPLRARWHRLRKEERKSLGSGAINLAFVGRMGLRDRFDALSHSALSAPRTLREDHRRRLDWGIHTFILEALDRASAAFGVEPRYPFYDRRLIEFCLALPPEQRLGAGWTRGILRRAMEGILPREVQWRVGKGDPGPNFFRALRHYEGARLHEFIVEHPDLIDPYFDIPALRAMYDRYTAAAARPEEILELWKALTLGVWLKREG